MNSRTFLACVATSPLLAAEPAVPQFRAVTLDPAIQIGYGLAVADVDGDKLPDILLADKKQIVWYRNPGNGAIRQTDSPPHAGWAKHVIAENLTTHDHVCIAAQDIDGDGKAEVAVGAEWNPSDTEKSGAVFYLQPPADRTQRWNPIRFPEVEPTTHRMRWIRLGGKPENSGSAASRWGLLVVPLHGRGNKNGEGAPVNVLLYHPPASVSGGKATSPAAAAEPPWKSETVDASLHMTHNFSRLAIAGAGADGPADGILLGGKEGLVALRRAGGQWQRTVPTSAGAPTVGMGEVRLGSLVNGTQFIATVEPMHGSALAVYLPQKAASGPVPLARRVLTEKLVDGHALACGDLLGGLPGVSAADQIVVGWRGKPGAPGSTTGLAVWAPLDAQGEHWRETVIDPDGMACEDLALADLDGDGKLDIIAAGRATKNVKIYFNETPR